LKPIVLSVLQLSVMLLSFWHYLWMYIFLSKFRAAMYSTEDRADTDEAAVAK